MGVQWSFYAGDAGDRERYRYADNALVLTAKGSGPSDSSPLWFVNGQYDQLRVNERLFLELAPHAELIVVPRTTHHVTVMRPQVFNALLNVAITTLEQT